MGVGWGFLVEEAITYRGFSGVHQIWCTSVKEFDVLIQVSQKFNVHQKNLYCQNNNPFLLSFWWYCNKKIINHQFTNSLIIETPLIFIAAEAAYSDDQVPGDRWQETCDT